MIKLSTWRDPINNTRPLIYVINFFIITKHSCYKWLAKHLRYKSPVRDILWESHECTAPGVSYWFLRTFGTQCTRGFKNYRMRSLILYIHPVTKKKPGFVETSSRSLNSVLRCRNIDIWLSRWKESKDPRTIFNQVVVAKQFGVECSSNLFPHKRGHCAAEIVTSSSWSLLLLSKYTA